MKTADTGNEIRCYMTYPLIITQITHREMLKYSKLGK